MKKYFGIILVLLLVALCCVGCSNHITASRIEKDLISYNEGALLNEDETIISLEILEEQYTEIHNNEYAEIACSVIIADEKRHYGKECFVTYVYSKDDKDWFLYEAFFNDKSAWTISPIVGVDEEEIVQSLYGTSLTLNSDVWTVTEQNISLTSIDEHVTDLEKNTDMVKVSVSIDDTVQTITGQFTLQYQFNKNWELVSVDEKNTFVASYKPGLEFDATSELLVDAIDKQTFTFGVQNLQTQIVTINKSELSDFEIKQKEISNKGAKTTYTCVGTLTKKSAVLSLEAEIIYSYSNQWNFSSVQITSKLVSVNAVGTWSGSNVYGRTCILKITSVDKDGNVKGTYTDKGDRYYKPYSYNISGKLDMATLRFTLDAGSLLSAKPYSAFRAEDITALLKIDNCTITGNADLKFTVALK